MPGKQRQNSVTSIGSVNPLLDGVNVQLLRALLDDPRLPIAALARCINMSAPAVTERLHRLEESKVIAGYHLDLDPKALGLPVTAYIRVRPGPGQIGKIAELAQDTPQVVECHRITGEDCFLLKVHAAAVDQFEAILDRFLAFGQTTTSIVQSSPVPLRALPLPSQEATTRSPGAPNVDAGGAREAARVRNRQRRHDA